MGLAGSNRTTVFDTGQMPLRSPDADQGLAVVPKRWNTAADELFSLRCDGDDRLVQFPEADPVPFRRAGQVLVEGICHDP